MAVRDVFKDERRRMVDETSGREYIQLTSTSRNKHLYLYVNCFDPQGRLIFVSERDGFLNYYRMDLDTGVAMQLTAETDIAAAGLACHNSRHGKLVYWAGMKMRMLDTETLECRTLIDYPRYGGYLTMTADGKHIVTFYDMGAPIDKPVGPKVGPWGIFSVPVDDPGSVSTPSGNPVLETRAHVNHIQASPTDPDLIEYSWEGEWRPQRMWVTNLAGDEGGPLGRQRPNELRGHEFWFANGSKMGYHGSKETPAGRRGIIGTVSSDGKDEWQLTLVGNRCGHCAYHEDRDLWVTDTSPDFDGLCFIRIEGQGANATGLFEPLCLHGSTWKSQGCHPHPQFSPDGRRLMWTSDREGVSQVYLMEI